MKSIKPIKSKLQKSIPTEVDTPDEKDKDIERLIKIENIIGLLPKTPIDMKRFDLKAKDFEIVLPEDSSFSMWNLPWVEIKDPIPLLTEEEIKRIRLMDIVLEKYVLTENLYHIIDKLSKNATYINRLWPENIDAKRKLFEETQKEFINLYVSAMKNSDVNFSEDEIEWITVLISSRDFPKNKELYRKIQKEY